MEIDHTKAVEKRIEAIIIKALDSCAFYEPKAGSLVAVKLCAYCKFGEFKDNHQSGLCKYRLECKGRTTHEEK